jgi:hypothetical protein
MDSRSVAKAAPFRSGRAAGPPSVALPQAATPRREGRLFTMTDLPVHDPDLGVHHADPGVHHGPIRVFTFGRSERSRWTDARTGSLGG